MSRWRDMDTLEVSGYVRLEWVRVDGQADLRRCSDFIEVPRRKRPRVFCPGCDAPVTLRAGQVRRPHAAHLPDSECSYSQGDNALHENAKHHLVDQLRQMSTLWVRLFCAEPEPFEPVSCRRARILKFATGWDQVIPERTVDHRRPDIVLMRDGKPIAAIEIYVRHAVDRDKRLDLAASGLPWVEISASEVIPHERPAWTPTKPLTIRACGPDAPWCCGKCRKPPPEKKRSPRYFDPFYCVAREKLDAMLKAAWEQVCQSESDKPKALAVVMSPVGDSFRPESVLVLFSRRRPTARRYYLHLSRSPTAQVDVQPVAPLREQATVALAARSNDGNVPDFVVPWMALDDHLPRSHAEFVEWVGAFGLPRWWRKPSVEDVAPRRPLTLLDLAMRVARHVIGGHALWSRSQIQPPGAAPTVARPTVVAVRRSWGAGAKSLRESPKIRAIA